MNKILLTLCISLLVGGPAVAFAGPIIRTGETVSVDSTQILKTDFYGFASKVTLSGSAEDDVIIGGGTVTVTAPVAKDLTILGGVVQIHGDVGDDLRVIGGEVTLGEVVVKGDVVVMGGTLTILSNAVIEGDVLFLGEEIVVEGDVAGTIHGSSDSIRINGKVGGDVQYTSRNQFVLGDKANILGNIQYSSYNDLKRATDAQVAGAINKNKVAPQTNKEVLQVYFFFVLMLLFSALGVFLIARRYVESLMQSVKNGPALSGLVGLGIFLFVPFVSSLLLVSAVGVLGGIILLVLYLLLLLLSITLAGIVLGYGMQLAFLKEHSLSLVTVCGGVVLFTIIGMIPYLGGLIMFGCLMIALGALSLSLYHSLRS